MVSPTNFEPEHALLAGYTDWTVDIDLAKDYDYLKATVAHRSPFVYFKSKKDPVTLDIAESFKASISSIDSRILLVHNDKKITLLLVQQVLIG